MARSNWRTLSTYKTEIGADEGVNFVRYHSTRIVEWNADTITLRTGGWDTVTTRRKMNQASHQFLGGSYSVFRRKGESYVTAPDGQTFPLEDRMTFSRHVEAPSIVPAPTSALVEG
jgi:hypothetical protein